MMDSGEFNTDPGLAMKVIRHQYADAENIIKSTNRRKVDSDTADFLNDFLNLKLVYEKSVEEGSADMCKAMENYTKKIRIEGAIGALQDVGMSTQQIVEVLVKKYLVSQEYVEGLMRSATA